MSATYPQRGFQLPPDATELLLIRHGASAAAVPGEPFELPAGQADPELAPEGREQAEQVAAWAAGERPSALFGTPLRRTAEPAQPPAKAAGIGPRVGPATR